MKFFNTILILSILSLCQCYPHEYLNSDNNEESQKIKTYRPVVLLHGLTPNNSTMEIVKMAIEKEHPGAVAYHPLKFFYGLDSYQNLWIQIASYYDDIKKKVDDTNGINLVVYSQGGLVARGLIEHMGLKVHNLITLSSPLAGQYGDHALSELSLTKETAYKQFYGVYQNYSVPQYWNDPHHQKEYLANCTYLPIINNELKGKENKTYADNFKSLNKLVLIGGPDDGVISPWQSSHFSFYDENEHVVDFREREIYTKDLFGLRTLDEQNKIQIYVRSGLNHSQWDEDDYVIQNFILPWLD